MRANTRLGIRKMCIYGNEIKCLAFVDSEGKFRSDEDFSLYKEENLHFRNGIKRMVFFKK